jgi:hypothetical protein
LLALVVVVVRSVWGLAESTDSSEGPMNFSKEIRRTMQQALERLDARYSRTKQYLTIAVVVAGAYSISGVSQGDQLWLVFLEGTAGFIVGPIVYSLLRRLASKLNRTAPPISSTR